MKIETDFSIIMKRDIAIPSNKQGNEEVGNQKITGFRYDNDIYQTKMNLLDLIATLCHEVGHVKGDNISFRQGLGFEKDANILTFDEIKDKNLHLDLPYKEILFLKNNILSDQKFELKGEALSIAFKLLYTFYKGEFKLDEVSIHNVTQEELDSLVRENGSTTTKTINEEIILINSKKGRNSELPSIFTEAACLLIMENTLKYYGILEKNDFLVHSSTGSPSHQRAQNIVARAYGSHGWKIPSMKDLKF